MKVPSMTINGSARALLGKKGSKVGRREGLIPCVIYTGDQNVHFNTTISDVRHLVYSPDFKLADIALDGNSFSCIVKEIQFHPVTEAIVHMDFQQLIPDRKVIVELPLRFRGTSPGVKVGGKLIQNVRKVKVKSLPNHLLNELIVDISTLELGGVIRVRDIDVESGIEIMLNPSVPVAQIEIPRALKGGKS